MDDLKEYPTDEEYESDPRYWQDFLRRQKEHRKKLEQLIRQAFEEKNWAWLQNQIILIGVKQTQLKNWLLKHTLGEEEAYNLLNEDEWSEKTPPKIRKKIMEASSEVPRWQRREILYVIDMYHEIMEMANWLLPRRGYNE